MLWDGCLSEKGYGLVKYKGRKRRVIRIVLSVKLGRDLDPKIEACHSCDTPACCADDHLFEGTTKQNAQDRHAKGRTRGCCQGAA